MFSDIVLHIGCRLYESAVVICNSNEILLWLECLQIFLARIDLKFLTAGILSAAADFLYVISQDQHLDIVSYSVDIICELAKHVFKSARVSRRLFESPELDDSFARVLLVPFARQGFDETLLQVQKSAGKTVEMIGSRDETSHAISSSCRFLMVIIRSEFMNNSSTGSKIDLWQMVSDFSHFFEKHIKWFSSENSIHFIIMSLKPLYSYLSKNSSTLSRNGKQKCEVLHRLSDVLLQLSSWSKMNFQKRPRCAESCSKLDDYVIACLGKIGWNSDMQEPTILYKEGTRENFKEWPQIIRKLLETRRKLHSDLLCCSIVTMCRILETCEHLNLRDADRLRFLDDSNFFRSKSHVSDIEIAVEKCCSQLNIQPHNIPKLLSWSWNFSTLSFAQWLRRTVYMLLQNVEKSDSIKLCDTMCLFDSDFAETIFPFALAHVFNSSISSAEKIKVVDNLQRMLQIASDETKYAERFWRLGISTIAYLRIQNSLRWIPIGVTALAKVNRRKSKSFNSVQLAEKLNFLIVAKAALRCRMYHHALLNLELWHQMNGDWDQDWSSEEIHVENMFLEIFKNLDDPDSMRGLKPSARASTLAVIYEQNQRFGGQTDPS